MRWNDRVEALKRSEKYRKDFEEYEAWRIQQGIDECVVVDAFEQKMSEKAKALCNKYHLPFPLHPEKTMIHDFDGNVVGYMEKDGKAPAIKIDFARLEKRKGRSPVAWDNDFLTIQLRIDTSQTQKQIVDEFSARYEHLLLQKLGKKKRSSRTSLTYQGKEIDHWLVFDMMKEKKNLAKVMKEFFGITKNPTYDKEAKARYEPVRRFYQKALNLMAEFEGK